MNNFVKGMSVFVTPASRAAHACACDTTVGKAYTVCGVGDDSGTERQTEHLLALGEDLSNMVSIIDDAGDIITLDSQDFTLVLG